MARFRNKETGEVFEVERETKVLKLISVENSDYYRGKNHDTLTFVDNENHKYIYDATINADMTVYDTKFASELAFEEGKYVKISAYFLPTYLEQYGIDKKAIYNPRLLSIED